MEAIRLHYLKTSTDEKQKMLDEFTAAIGYHWNHTTRDLKSQVQVQSHLKRKSKTYKTMYDSEMAVVDP